MRIYIVDYMGIHCGMHYYLQSFQSLILGSGLKEVEILSNFKNDKNVCFFRNQYEGVFFKKCSNLIVNYLRFSKFLKAHNDDCVIFLSYGNYIELPFLRLLSKIPKHMVDVHEVIAQHLDNKKIWKNRFKRCYTIQIKNVIFHSKRSRSLLNDLGYKGTALYVPHVRYAIDKSVSSLISSDIMESVVLGKTNILFFGNLTYEKGTDILISAINEFEESYSSKIHIIIAGKNIDGSVYSVKPLHQQMFSFIVRHIEDEELIYLYKNVDFVAMPYRKTSQSGVLEMAFYFHKPIIASGIPYFKEMLAKFPSFGVIQKEDDIGYKSVITEALSSNKVFYSDMDCLNYMKRPEYEEFVQSFKIWLLK